MFKLTLNVHEYISHVPISVPESIPPNITFVSGFGFFPWYWGKNYIRVSGLSWLGSWSTASWSRSSGSAVDQEKATGTSTYLSCCFKTLKLVAFLISIGNEIQILGIHKAQRSLRHRLSSQHKVVGSCTTGNNTTVHSTNSSAVTPSESMTTGDSWHLEIGQVIIREFRNLLGDL